MSWVPECPFGRGPLFQQKAKVAGASGVLVSVGLPRTPEKSHVGYQTCRPTVPSPSFREQGLGSSLPILGRRAGREARTPPQPPGSTNRLLGLTANTTQCEGDRPVGRPEGPSKRSAHTQTQAQAPGRLSLSHSLETPLGALVTMQHCRRFFPAKA